MGKRKDEKTHEEHGHGPVSTGSDEDSFGGAGLRWRPGPPAGHDGDRLWRGTSQWTRKGRRRGRRIDMDLGLGAGSEPRVFLNRLEWQLNGEFSTAERYGIEIGLRAQERFGGLLEATPSLNGKIGTYQAETGFSTGTRATWNYDWHVDLRNARGVAAGTTLADYDLTLETDMFSSLFGFPDPADLTFGYTDPNFVAPNAVLFQESFNPDFGNSEFDPLGEDTYHLSLILTPESFNGPPLEVTIQVVVTDQS